jgi:hypothetical protein
MAIMCTIALVEPLIDSCVANAFSKLALVSKLRGVTFPHANSTARLPVATASLLCSATTAGMLAAFGKVNPNASAMHAIVEAVPIVMHVPADLAMQFSTPFQSHSERFPAQRSAQYFQASVPLPSV